MPANPDTRSEIFFMLISAGLFAYFGFGSSWVHQYTAATATPPNQWLPMVAVLEWSLKGGAVAFGLAAVISMAGSIFGPMLYAATGLITSLAFIAVAIWQWTNPQGYYSGMSPLLLVLFAAWNGFGSYSSLREVLASRRNTATVS
jgi:hypothetical protein